MTQHDDGDGREAADGELESRIFRSALSRQLRELRVRLYDDEQVRLGALLGSAGVAVIASAVYNQLREAGLLSAFAEHFGVLAAAPPSLEGVARQMYEDVVSGALGAGWASTAFEERYSWTAIPEAARQIWRTNAQDHLLHLGFSPEHFPDWDGRVNSAGGAEKR